MTKVIRPPRPQGKQKPVAVSAILMAPASKGPRTKARPVPRKPKRKPPLAARGKTTRKGKVVKALKSVFTGVKPNVSMKTKARQFALKLKKRRK